MANKTVLITGSSSGIGLATAKYFVAQGWNVVATMRNPTPNHELTKIKNVLVIKLDVQKTVSIGEAIEKGASHFGRLDVLINNAGFGQYGLFEATTKEQIRQQFEVNVFGVMDVTRAVLPYFREKQAGVIVNVSSGAGIFTLPMISLYCASKFALEGFSESLSYELASQNIIVKIVQPHGGVSATKFNERAAKENATDSSLRDYDAFVKVARESFAKSSAARTQNADDVAKAIFAAATDGTSQLRYLVGTDTRGFVKARQEMKEQDYMRFMRSHFNL
jgi:NAD(P)-dependent dehydrogenase (short-subunit alcohol dehydrogenase family)